MRINYMIVFVPDMARSVSFYRDVVGMPLKFETPEWTEFVTEGATFALHKSDPPGEATEQGEDAMGCRAGFEVPDIDEFHARMIENSVACVRVPTLTFGARIAQYRDPDGLIFIVAEERNSK